jgi:uncharacterized protein (DUF2126 family)
MGYRLPLDSLPWVAKGDYPYVEERDPFAARAPLPSWSTLRERPVRQAPLAGDPSAAARAPRPLESAADIVRSALCVEARQGTLHVFLPPVGELDDYLDLVLAVEETARERAVSIRVEGYPPPSDPRLMRFSVTPDPGVIEVNVHPARSFAELTETVSALYDEARKSRLGTEKFTMDGRHSGTGRRQSPDARRTDARGQPFSASARPPREPRRFLPRSPGALVPVLGRLHRTDESGSARGRSAPRSDARARDRLRHRAVARRGLAPWITDRVFRHVLADVTGNTHRSEFCIDKLYSPDSASGASVSSSFVPSKCLHTRA